MKVKLRKCKKSPALLVAEQVKGKKGCIFDENSTSKRIRKEIPKYVVPNHVIYDDYKSTTSKSNW